MPGSTSMIDTSGRAPASTGASRPQTTVQSPTGGDQRHGLAQVGAPAEKRDDDGARERNEQREQGQPLAAHRIPPSRLADALAAIPAVHSVSKPK